MERGEVAVDPTQEEFFAEKEARPDGVVREGVQNTLDAAVPGQKARVRYTFSKTPLPTDTVERYLSGLRPHLEPCVPALPSPGEPMHYLLVEDFGTRGLCGDPAQYTDEPGAAATKNDFYYFWRNVGRSSKSETQRGRWGLGKQVFPAASRIRTFWGLTVRRDDGQSLLMGQSVLAVHMLNGERHSPYAYYGSSHVDGFSMPVSASSAVDAFRQDFGLARKNEPGFSVVIPYPAEDITPGELLRSSIRNYFFPILQGSLVIEVCHGGTTETIDGTTLREVAARQDWLKSPDTSKEKLEALFDMTVWALGQPDAEHYQLALPGAGAPAWSEQLFKGKELEALRERFERGERLAFRVPIKVERKGGAVTTAHFDLYLEKDARLARGEDHYIRQGITITEIHLLRESGVRGMVVVRDPELSSLLGDSEGPAHTDWYERSRKLKERYEYGVSCVRFVRGGLREIVRLLARPPEGLKEDLLRDLFFVMEPGAGGAASPGVRPGPGKERPEPVPPPAPPPPPEKTPFRLQQRAGGFTVTGIKDRPPPKEIRVRAAYEVRRGDAFKRYDPQDFDFSSSTHVDVVGARVKSSAENVMVIEVSAPDFDVKVTGFDPNRDLKVQAKEVTPQEEEG